MCHWLQLRKDEVDTEHLARLLGYTEERVSAAFERQSRTATPAFESDLGCARSISDIKQMQSGRKMTEIEEDLLIRRAACFSRKTAAV